MLATLRQVSLNPIEAQSPSHTWSHGSDFNLCLRDSLPSQLYVFAYCDKSRASITPESSIQHLSPFYRRLDRLCFVVLLPPCIYTKTSQPSHISFVAQHLPIPALTIEEP